MFTLHQFESGRAGSPLPAASVAKPNGGAHGVSRPASDQWIETLHSNKMCSPATGKSYDPPTPKHFSFNAPAGACPVCHGLGQKMVFDEALVVPDPELPLDGAIQPWRRAGKRLIIYYKAMLRSVAAHFGVSTETLYKDLPDVFKQVLLNGSGEDEIEFNSGAREKSAASRVRLKASCQISNASRRTVKANSSATGSRPT